MFKPSRYKIVIRGIFLCIIILGLKSSYTPKIFGPDILNDVNLNILRYPQEKLYLHVDRQSYLAGDDIWYKSYLLNSAIPDCNLYVELVNSTGIVILKNISWSQGAYAYGDFHLPDTISSGKYQLRAYTSWMRNFDDSWFFRKNLLIWNLEDKEIPSEKEVLSSRDIDFQFFPESGVFLSNIKNRLAFKAVDKNGNSLDVTGDVFDDQGNLIVSFKSTHNGLGSFEIMPENGKKYKAKLSIAGFLSKEVYLPEASKTGTIMKVEADNDNLNIRILENLSSEDKSHSSDYLLVAQARGFVFFQKEISLQNDFYTFNLEKAELPLGIVKFTLFGENMIPRCERLVFINHNDFMQVEVMPDKSKYSPRGKVELNISTLSSKGLPYVSNLSMAVVNPKNLLPLEDYPNNISTQFLIASELKGRIENPAYYFKDDSVSTQNALDNLMLTHGYRYFEWKEIRDDNLPDIVYQPDDCIQLKGTVKSILLNKPVPDASVTMMTLKSLLEVSEQKSDSAGQFLFTDLYFNDTMTVLLQTNNPNGKRNSYIELNNISATSPMTEQLAEDYNFGKKNPTETSTNLNDLRADLINKKWNLSDTILLADVTISRRKQEKQDEHVRIYGEADFVVDMAKQESDIYNVFDAIDGKFPGVRYSNLSESFSYRNKPVLLYLNGMKADADLIGSLPGNAFDKIELIRIATSAGVNYDGGILFFYTKRGAMFENTRTVSLGMKSTNLIGYSVIRKFYSPQHKDPENPSGLKDFRSTIYWNPLVITDSKGMAKVEFYNSDDFGEMQIFVEGLTSDGKLCRGVGSYKVNY